MNVLLRGERYVSQMALGADCGGQRQRYDICRIVEAIWRAHGGAPHTRRLGVRPGLVGRMDGSRETRAYCVVVRTGPRWPFWPLPQGLWIDAAFAVRRRWVSWINP